MEKMIFSPVEVRVLGCLIEKEMATPEYYPLTLNALTNACNQKSNRDPVMQLEEAEVTRSLDRLRHAGFAMQAHGEGSRVPKFRHALVEKLYLEPEELAVIGELLLRGPQTIGELRARAERMHPFRDLAEVERALQELAQRQPPLTVMLPRQPGRRESRYMHLLSGEPELGTSEEALETAGPGSGRLDQLEKEVAILRDEVAELRKELAELKAQLE
jgi:uncharacterized protein